jgi:hypothetical protein
MDRFSFMVTGVLAQKAQCVDVQFMDYMNIHSM